MRRSTFAIALVWALSAILQAQELQEGTWTGTLLRAPRQGGNNPQPQRVSLEVKKIPDPLWRWRPGRGEVLEVVLVVPQLRAPVTDLEIGKTSLSFSYQRDDIQINCRLNHQPDGAYEGECVGEGDPRKFRLSLTPPKAAP